MPLLPPIRRRQLLLAACTPGTALAQAAPLHVLVDLRALQLQAEVLEPEFQELVVGQVRPRVVWAATAAGRGSAGLGHGPKCSETPAGLKPETRSHANTTPAGG